MFLKHTCSSTATEAALAATPSPLLPSLMADRSIDRLPPVLVPLLAHMVLIAGPLLESGQRDLDSVELFAGQQEITKAMLSQGFQSHALDKSYDPLTQDLTTAVGFRTALECVCRLRPGGSLWAAPVCSTWGFISRLGTGRSLSNPAGDTNVTRVRNANQQVICVVMLAILAWYRGCHVWVEQPRCSLMAHFSPFQELVAHVLPHRALTHLGAFGASSAKPLQLWSSSPAVHELARPKPKHSEQVLTRRDSRGVHGKRNALCASQAYPKRFGHAVAEVFQHELLGPPATWDFGEEAEAAPAAATKTTAKAAPAAANKGNTKKKAKSAQPGHLQYRLQQ